MNIFTVWKDFRRWQREQLADYAQIEGPHYAGELAPRKKQSRVYEIRQTHEVVLQVRVSSQEELLYWDQAVVVALETPEGEVIPHTHSSIVHIDSYRENKSKFSRLDAPERGGSHPPITQEKRRIKRIEEIVPDNPSASIGLIARIRGKDYVYCINCEEDVNQNKDVMYANYILQDQTNETGYYTCHGCKKNFI